jgi:hypothetical protein
MAKVLLSIIISILFVTACSPGENEGSREESHGDHVWRAQTDTLEKAKDVDQVIQDAAERQRRALEEQGG